MEVMDPNEAGAAVVSAGVEAGLTVSLAAAFWAYFCIHPSPNSTTMFASVSEVSICWSVVFVLPVGTPTALVCAVPKAAISGVPGPTGICTSGNCSGLTCAAPSLV